MENADLKGVLFEQPAQIQINRALKDKCVKIVRINGLFSSSKSFAISGAVISGIHLIVADTKEQAQMYCWGMMMFFIFLPQKERYRG